MTRNYDLSKMLTLKLNDNGCWSNFNSKYRYYQFLVEFSRICPLVKEEDIPSEPKPSDNNDLSC
jgi:hypothetical protein